MVRTRRRRNQGTRRVGAKTLGGSSLLLLRFLRHRSHSITTMNDEDFEDLFSGNAYLLQPSSQGSLIGAATNLAIEHEDDAGEPHHHPQSNDHVQSEGDPDSLPDNTSSFAQDILHNDFRPAERVLPRPYPKYGSLPTRIRPLRQL